MNDPVQPEQAGRRLSLSVDNTSDGYKEATRRVRATLTAWNAPEKAFYAAELILEEMLTNIIRYAFRDQERHPIEIELSMEQELLRLTLVDDGTPFDPTAPRPAADITSIEDAMIGGRGIRMVRSTVHSIHYERQGAKNRLTMTIAT